LLRLFSFGSLGGGRHASLSDLGSLLLVHVATLVLSLIATVIVPASLPTIVVVSEDESIHSRRVALCILDVGHSVELLANRSLNDDILLVLVILSRGLEVQLIVVCIRHHYLRLLHVHTYWQDALQGEVRVLDIAAIDLFILVEQVGVLELLDGLLRDLTDPVVHSEPAVLEDHLLQIIKLVTLVVVSLQVFDELANVLLLVHDLGRVRQVNRVNHHASNGALLHSQQLQEVSLIDLTDQLTDLDVTV